MVVLVTGAANGLGAGIVEALLALGARVALADVDEPAMTATRAPRPFRRAHRRGCR